MGAVGEAHAANLSMYRQATRKGARLMLLANYALITAPSISVGLSDAE